MDITLLYTPCANTAQAEMLAGALLKERLIACANILPGQASLYFWHGELQQETEVFLLCKTTPEHAKEAATLLEQLHPYECPCILMLPPVQANHVFARWVAEQTSSAPNTK